MSEQWLTAVVLPFLLGILILVSAKPGQRLLVRLASNHPWIAGEDGVVLAYWKSPFFVAVGWLGGASTIALAIAGAFELAPEETPSQALFALGIWVVRTILVSAGVLGLFHARSLQLPSSSALSKRILPVCIVLTSVLAISYGLVIGSNLLVQAQAVLMYALVVQGGLTIALVLSPRLTSPIRQRSKDAAD